MLMDSVIPAIEPIQVILNTPEPSFFVEFGPLIILIGSLTIAAAALWSVCTARQAISINQVENSRNRRHQITVIRTQHTNSIKLEQEKINFSKIIENRKIHIQKLEELYALILKYERWPKEFFDFRANDLDGQFSAPLCDEVHQIYAIANIHFGKNIFSCAALLKDSYTELLNSYYGYFFDLKSSTKNEDIINPNDHPCLKTTKEVIDTVAGKKVEQGHASVKFYGRYLKEQQSIVSNLIRAMDREISDLEINRGRLQLENKAQDS